MDIELIDETLIRRRERVSSRETSKLIYIDGGNYCFAVLLYQDFLVVRPFRVIKARFERDSVRTVARIQASVRVESGQKRLNGLSENFTIRLQRNCGAQRKRFWNCAYATTS